MNISFPVNVVLVLKNRNHKHSETTSARNDFWLNVDLVIPPACSWVEDRHTKWEMKVGKMRKAEPVYSNFMLKPLDVTSRTNQGSFSSTLRAEVPEIEKELGAYLFFFLLYTAEAFWGLSFMSRMNTFKANDWLCDCEGEISSKGGKSVTGWVKDSLNILDEASVVTVHGHIHPVECSTHRLNEGGLCS